MSKVISKSINLVIVYELEKTGALAGMTYQDIADLLGLGHKATAMRLMRSLDLFKKRLPEVREKVIRQCRQAA